MRHREKRPPDVVFTLSEVVEAMQDKYKDRLIDAGLSGAEVRVVLDKDGTMKMYRDAR